MVCRTLALFVCFGTYALVQNVALAETVAPQFTYALNPASGNSTASYPGDIVVTGSIRGQGATNIDETVYNVWSGFHATADYGGAANSNSNIYIGVGPMVADNFAAANNVAIGSFAFALAGPTSGSDTAIGQRALYRCRACGNVTAIGQLAGTNVTTAVQSVAVGYAALYSDARAGGTGAANTAIGSQAMFNATSAASNSVVGFNSANAITSGSDNSAIGYSSLAHITTGSGNQAFGEALYSLNSGHHNVGVGNGALNALTTGNGNVGIGLNALLAALGNSNTALGTQSGEQNLTGDLNLYLGYQAGQCMKGGNGNVVIGAGSCPNKITGSNQLDIAGLVHGDIAANHAALGSSGSLQPSVSNCGTHGIDMFANDSSGQVTISGGAPGSCTVTFRKAYGRYNHCQVSAERSIVGFGYSYTLAAIIFTGTGLAGKFDYRCDGV